MTVTSTELGDDARNVTAGNVSYDRAPTTSTRVLITEQQVMLGSAAAISAPLPRHRHVNPFRAALRGLHRVVTWEPNGTEDRHRKHPAKTPAWYSDALMAREMRRL